MDCHQPPTVLFPSPAARRHCRSGVGGLSLSTNGLPSLAVRAHSGFGAARGIALLGVCRVSERAADSGAAVAEASSHGASAGSRWG